MKSNAAIHIPKIFYFEICGKRIAAVYSRNIIGKVTEVISSLYKSSHAEYSIESIKALCPQGAKKLPVFLKTIFVGSS